MMTFEEAVDHYNLESQKARCSDQPPDNYFDLMALQAVIQMVADLEARLYKLSDRMDSLCQVNELWDGG